jgi:large subunit ribosomal protein L25
METNILKAVLREESGKGPARRLRQRGFIPAVFYGPKAGSIPISIESADFLKIMKDGDENKFIKLIIEDRGQQIEKLSMIKDFQIEPIDRNMLHADFYEISMDHKLTIEVPIHFKGQPIGVTEGGELLHVKREVKISCLPGDLPEFIEIDISNLKIGDTIKIQDINVGKDITVLDQGDTAIVIVTSVKTAAEPEKTEETTAEPELVGKKTADQED